MKYRVEHDTMGDINVSVDKYWGAQTQRSIQNFKIGNEKMPTELIKALVIIKMVAAKVNCELGILPAEYAGAIQNACLKICNNDYLDQFPLSVWQTGSGTQTNMNVNEVISHIANIQLGDNFVHPNDHVNMGQSSNDAFPSAINIAIVSYTQDNLLPSLELFRTALVSLQSQYGDIVKIGRTHLQDATPVLLGQEIGGWIAIVDSCCKMISESNDKLRALALGGTAVGTGLNTHKNFGKMCAEEISKYTNSKFYEDDNKFHALSSKDTVVYAHGALKALAADMMKIANDIRWYASGPRCGIGEWILPENEPGSSIMPGKVNPTQCEAITMVAVQVMGNDTTVGFAASQGNFQLNVFMPVIAYNYIQSLQLLCESINSFTNNCVVAMRPNLEKINTYLQQSLMLVTALNPYVGYENSAKIAKIAYEQGKTLRQTAEDLGLIDGDKFDSIVDPKKMVFNQE